MRFFSNIFLFLVTLCSLGSTKSTQATQAFDILDRVVAEVNGRTIIIQNGATQRIIWGDEIKIHAAFLEGGDSRLDSINFVGFPNHDQEKPADDRGRVIRTHRDLLESWSKNGEGKEYEVKVSKDDLVVGSVTFELVKPKLYYAVLMINGEEKVVRESDELKVKSTDQFKVTRFETNLERPYEGVQFSLVKASQASDNGQKGNSFELRFHRFSSPFAHIYLRIAPN